MEPSRQLSMGPILIFKEGILLSLSRWWALQMAVVNEWGGRNSALLAEQLGEDILSRFTQSNEPLYIDDLEQILEKGLMSLNTMEEDGSIEEKIREASAKEAGHSNIKKVVNDDDDNCSDTDESMDMAVDALEHRSNQTPGAIPVDEPKPAQVVDPGGWTAVGSRKNKGRKNSAPCFLPYGPPSSVYPKLLGIGKQHRIDLQNRTDQISI